MCVCLCMAESLHSGTVLSFFTFTLFFRTISVETKYFDKEEIGNLIDKNIQYCLITDCEFVINYNFYTMISGAIIIDKKPKSTAFGS